eukprot:scaffold106841_cov60-Phaeocystis_antarctica.AAC.1
MGTAATAPERPPFPRPSPALPKVLAAGGPVLARSFRAASSASCTCRSRRLASGPAERWALITQSGVGCSATGAPPGPSGRRMVVRVRSPCSTPRAPLLESALGDPPPLPASSATSAAASSSATGRSDPSAWQSAQRSRFQKVAGRMRPFASSAQS